MATYNPAKVRLFSGSVELEGFVSGDILHFARHAWYGSRGGTDLARVIITHATAATVYRWATRGSRRLRGKYRSALTICRVLNRREAPVMGCDATGRYGVLGDLKVAWGEGHFRSCGPLVHEATDRNGIRHRRDVAGVEVRPYGWADTESRRALVGRQIHPEAL